MTNLLKCLADLKLPPFVLRETTHKIIQSELFGIPTSKFKLIDSDIIEKNNDFLQNTVHEKIRLTYLITDDKSYSFDVDIAYPKGGFNLPSFLHISFNRFEDSDVEIIKTVTDNGFVFVNVYYQDITTDDDNFTTGVCGCMDVDFNAETRPGKICCWAMGLVAIIDYLCENPVVNNKMISVVGHSRLGKTALLTAVMDERVFLAVSNNSGASGASLARGTTGETVADIVNKFPFWFAKTYHKYAENECNMPFDQHYLLSLIAPRYLYISSAMGDGWACPKNEFLSAVSVNEVYRNHGKDGLICDDFIPTEPIKYHEGNVGYHLREGFHGLKKYDWKLFISFIKEKIES